MEAVAGGGHEGIVEAHVRRASPVLGITRAYIKSYYKRQEPYFSSNRNQSKQEFIVLVTSM